MSLLIIGCGNMGGAMLAGWLAGGMDPATITVVDPLRAEVPANLPIGIYLLKLRDPRGRLPTDRHAGRGRGVSVRGDAMSAGDPRGADIAARAWV